MRLRGRLPVRSCLPRHQKANAAARDAGARENRALRAGNRSDQETIIVLPLSPVARAKSTCAPAGPPSILLDGMDLVRDPVLHPHGERSAPTTGTVNMNRVPPSGVLSAQMRPPCAVTIPREMYRPSPRPLVRMSWMR